MKPKINPSADSLVSGMTTSSQPSQTPVSYSDQKVPFAKSEPIPPNTPVVTPFQASPTAQENSFTQADPFVASTISPLGENATSYQQPPQPVDLPTANPAYISPPQGAINSNILEQPNPITAQPSNTPKVSTQTTSPLDSPPAPATQPQVVQSPINLGSAVVDEKPKKKLPVFLLFLLLLVVVVLGVVGFLAFQNYQLNKNTADKTIQQPTLKAPEAVNPYLGYVVFKSTILPIEFMIPSDWKTEESKDIELANQKMVKSNSTDFVYEGSEIAQGYEFRIGPVNDLTKKYDSFDAFSVEENTDNLYTSKSINGTTWLVKGNEAKTLVESSPVTIALYTSKNQIDMGSELFSKIFNSVKISAQPVSGTPSTASPSATP